MKNKAIKNKIAIKNNIINHKYNKKFMYYNNIIDDNLILLLAMQYLYAHIEFKKSFSYYKYFYYPKNNKNLLLKLRSENL